MLDLAKFLNSDEEKVEKVDYIRAYKQKTKTPVKKVKKETK